MAYYYCGDLEKSFHYHDRNVRGKIESDDSVIKRVSNNLIQSKRMRPKYEFYLNPDLLAEYLQKKQNQMLGLEVERTDFGLSKAYRLLPHYKGRDDPSAAENDAPGDAVKRKL